MPTVTVVTRPTQSLSPQDWKPPVKTIQAASTGMQIKTPEASKTEQPVINKAADPALAKPGAETAVQLSPQLTSLARKEQKFRQEQEMFKAQQAALAAKEAKYAKYEALEQKLAARDYSAVEELGVSYDAYTQWLIEKAEGTKPEVQALKKLEDEVAHLKTSQEQNTNKQYEATVAQYRKEIEQLVGKDPAYASVKELKREEYVLQHILDTFHEDGEVLTVEEAAKEIEEALVEEAVQMANLTAVKAKLQPPAETLPQQQKLPPPKSGLRTLTQQVVADQPRSANGQFQHLSPQERIAQAIARAQRGT